MADLGSPEFEQSDAEQDFKSEFLKNLVELPVIKFNIGTYKRVKGYNRMTTTILNATESSARYLAAKAKPYLKNMEPTAQAIDKVFCESLNVVKEKYPIITKEMNDFDDLFVEKANQVLDKTEDLVDKYLPDFKEDSKESATDSKESATDSKESATDSKEAPSDSKEAPSDSKEAPSDSKEAPSDSKEAPTDSKKTPTDSKESISDVFDRVCKLNKKTSYRILCNSIKKIMLLQVLAEEFKSQWPKHMSCIRHFGEALLYKTLQEAVEAALKMWDEIFKDLSDLTAAEENLEERCQSLTCETAYVEVLETGKRHALELFTQSVKLSKSKEMLIKWLHSAKQKVSSLEEIVKNIETDS